MRRLRKRDEFRGLLALADAYAAAGRVDRARDIWSSVAAQTESYPQVLERVETRLADIDADPGA